MKTNIGMASAIALALVGAAVLSAAPASAEKVIGKWVQDGTSPVAAAYCDPHCHNDEGSTITVQTYYPENLTYHGKPVYLKNFAVKCISDTDWCVFDHTISTTDDTAQHKMTILFWSHSHAVSLQLSADEVVDDDVH